MSKEAENGVECFKDSFNCAQAVFSSHCERFGIQKENAYKIAGGFGGGMGHTGEACGAVTGAIMLIGLRYGKYKKEDMESKGVTYRKVQEFTEEFKKIHGSIKCNNLTKYNLGIESEFIKARDAGVFSNICPLFVKSSVEIVEKYLK